MNQQKVLAESINLKPSKNESKIKDNEIIIGPKNFINYVRSAEILLRNKNFNMITIRARGMNISKAVDLAESVKSKFCKDLNLKISNIITSTETYVKEGREFSVSTITLTLMK